MEGFYKGAGSARSGQAPPSEASLRAEHTREQIVSDPGNPASASLSVVEKLAKEDDLSGFDCGNPALNDWLKRFALVNQESDSSQTYVVRRDKAVAGYFSLTVGSIRPEESPARIAKGLARHPIGVVLLARLAVDKREQGTGLGKALLKNALIRIEAAADTVGVRAVLVHAIDQNARQFYEHFGFERSRADPFQLLLLMKDLRAQLRRKS